MFEHIKTNRRGLIALGTALAAAVQHGWANLFGGARAAQFTAGRKGERIAPLFTSADDLRAVVDEYCVRNADTPLAPEQIETLAAGVVPQSWIARGSGEGKIGATRFGGAPDLPKGTPWPKRKALPERAKAAAEGRFPKPWVVRQLAEEVPFEFVAQIDLAEAARHPDHANGLPHAGRLLFFVDDAVLMDEPAAPADGCLVIHDTTPRDGLQRIAVPARFDEMEAWWRTPDPKHIARYEAMAKNLKAAGQADAAKTMQEAVRAASNPDTSARKPFVYPARAMKLVPLVVLPDKHAIEVDADAALKALAEDNVAGEHYSLLTSNDTGPFTTAPDDMRVSQPWLMREARRNRLMGPPQPEQSDPRFDCIPQAEKPAYPWNEDQLVAMTKKAAEWRLLLQVSAADLSQTKTEGTLYFMIRNDDLARADFSRCRVTYQQT
ncbi:MAG: DUF1963 domain-containing protein [Hyphomicrobiaceae bacterium]